MLNKFYKTINNKYSKFFRFIFFLRYLITIFIISTALFVLIPNFFDYEKKANILKKHILENYNFEISSYEKINFKSLPFPRLELENVSIISKSQTIELKVKNLNIYPHILSIYNYDNFKIKKIFIEDNHATVDVKNLKFFFKQLFTQKNKFSFDNLNLKLIDQNKLILNIENIKFDNFGYNKNLIKGKIFDKKFKIKLDNNFKSINFIIPNSGIRTDILFDKVNKNEIIKGNLKSKILATNLKFLFELNDSELKINNLFLRNRNLFLSGESSIRLKPFFDIKSNVIIEDLNLSLLEKLDFNKLSELREIIKKINIKSKINFESKKISRSLFNELKLNIDLAYGRINYIKNFSLSNSNFKCSGNINLLEDFPLLSFNCFINSKDKQKFLKIFSIKTKEKNEIFQLNARGNLNILNKKINLKKISLNEKYEASEEDLKYFKEKFEDIILNESLLKMFKLKKIKNFILEIL